MRRKYFKKMRLVVLRKKKGKRFEKGKVEEVEE